MPHRPPPSVAGVVTALWRHPVKGFTPEPLDVADLPTDGWFPGDRMFAVEDGPSGFDRAAPAHLAKQNFTVLMRTAEVAGVRTRWDEAARVLHATAAGHADTAVAVDDPDSRAAFETWLAAVLGDAVSGPLRLVSAEGLDHRFMDHPLGRISLLNLASVRDFETRVGRPVDPRRFRANVWIEGWPAWIENDGADRDLTLGGARLRGVKPIVRCAATHVDPDTAERDFDLVPALFEQYGHRWCGLYATLAAGGTVRVGDRVEMT
ncbi:MAG: MOSC domain-containing protein [Alphaproteobacteria bacterium]|uniref:MOSC domain-containing protein n=1 Tax=Brevundimonas sp. TaxID=1871086 RepID=UPI0017EAFDF1|nr:MOSC domain-containing protein [Brevundimonas sp.]MBA3050770.1 MOSC domain-containing protein [Brevundimonas sp.]MBU4040896.1 MOSC domain-containing protein [Alphaproteobacteria bacterium]